ncbi:MAG: hypothetical protein H6671_16960 [Anaerolineaceae bacterium]|nr:hypothetical protein [Anaerolineaceae bacterium]
MATLKHSPIICYWPVTGEVRLKFEPITYQVTDVNVGIPFRFASAPAPIQTKFAQQCRILHIDRAVVVHIAHGRIA